MLDFFRSLLGIKKKSAPATAKTQKKFAALNEIAPLKNGEKNDKNKGDLKSEVQHLPELKHP